MSVKMEPINMSPSFIKSPNSLIALDPVTTTAINTLHKRNHIIFSEDNELTHYTFLKRIEKLPLSLNSVIININSVKISALESDIKLPDTEIAPARKLQDQLWKKLQEYQKENPKEEQALVYIVNAIMHFLHRPDVNMLCIMIPRCYEISKLPDILSDLQKLKSIETLTIIGIPNLPNISNLTNLENLIISDCDNINEIAIQISQLKNLRTLEILNCKYLTEVLDLSTLNKLSKVSVVGCSMINIQPTLPNKSCNLNISDCPMLTPPPTSMTLPPVITPQERITSYTIPSRVYDVLDVTEDKPKRPQNTQEHFQVSGCARAALVCNYTINKRSLFDQPTIPIYLLDGDVIEIPLEENLQQNPHLQSNLFIGKNIIKHVQETIIYSTNHMQRYAAIVKKDPLNNQPINSTLLKETSRIFNKNRGCKYDINNTPLSIAALREDSVGNCFEMSLFGHKYGEKFFPDQFIEPASIQPGDHLFLIIGRPPETSIESYKLWPDSVVICDPWSGACYPASKLESYLFDYVGSEDIYLNSDANKEEKLNSPRSLADETTFENHEAYDIPRVTYFNPVHQRISNKLLNEPIFLDVSYQNLGVNLLDDRDEWESKI